VATAVVALERSTLKAKVIDSPEVIAVIHEVSVCWTSKERGVCFLCGELCEYVLCVFSAASASISLSISLSRPFLFADIRVLRFPTSSDF
jgi:hypothetical protein